MGTEAVEVVVSQMQIRDLLASPAMPLTTKQTIRSGFISSGWLRSK